MAPGGGAIWLRPPARIAASWRDPLLAKPFCTTLLAGVFNQLVSGSHLAPLSPRGARNRLLALLGTKRSELAAQHEHHRPPDSRRPDCSINSFEGTSSSMAACRETKAAFDEPPKVSGRQHVTGQSNQRDSRLHERPLPAPIHLHRDHSRRPETGG